MWGQVRNTIMLKWTQWWAVMYLTVRCVTTRINVDRISKLEFGPRSINRYAVTPQVDLNTSAPLLELLQFREGSLTLSSGNFNTTDITAMIDILCTGWLAREVVLMSYSSVISFESLVAGWNQVSNNCIHIWRQFQKVGRRSTRKTSVTNGSLLGIPASTTFASIRLRPSPPDHRRSKRPRHRRQRQASLRNKPIHLRLRMQHMPQLHDGKLRFKMVIDELFVYALYSTETDAPIPNCTTSSIISTHRHKFPLQKLKSWASWGLSFGCQYIATRRQKTSWTAHEAEIDDISYQVLICKKPLSVESPYM